MDRTLLLVDDEQNILSALTRLFRREGYTILRAGSGAEALELLAHHSVGVIISDQRMPEMSGVELLSTIKALHPDTVRIMLSGYTDLKSVTDAINEGAIYKFLTKPWDDDLLKDNVKMAFQHFELVSENERLTRELQKANEQLARVNRQLETDVDLKTHAININHRALELSQDILECLPLGIIGLDNDFFIALANQKARAVLKTQSGECIGVHAADIFPEALKTIYAKKENDENQLNYTMNIELSGCRVSASAYPLQGDGTVHGTIIVLVPEELNRNN